MNQQALVDVAAVIDCYNRSKEQFMARVDEFCRAA